MIFSIAEIAKIINGKVKGNINAKINTLSKIEESVEGSICFLANSKYEKFLYQTKASAVIVSSDLKINFSTYQFLEKVSYLFFYSHYFLQ